MNFLAHMSWDEAKEYLARDNRVILPMGATEEHGRHLGLGTDFIEADAIAHASSESTGVAVAPSLNYGQSAELMDFPGTLTLKTSTLVAVLDDIYRALWKHGFRRIMIVNGHGGNTAAIYSSIVDLANELPDVRFKVFEWWKDAEINRIVNETMGQQAGSHASAAETAFMLAACPEAVKLQRLTGRDAPVISSRELTTVQTLAKKYPDGIMGLNPHAATAEVGTVLMRKSVEICSRELTEWDETTR